MDLCEIVLDEEEELDDADADEDSAELRISSDVKDIDEPELDGSGGGGNDLVTAANATRSAHAGVSVHVYPFPLRGGPFLCSQGFGGAFTHFYPGTQHAIDFECPVGTEVLALGPGVVTEISDGNTVTGIHVHNLFKWNSVMLHLDDGVFVEYVHIQAKSCRVTKGDRVRTGQLLCESGDVGFCPTPHLHLQMHSSGAPDAPTIPFALKGPDGAPPYVPVAGQFYSE